jgi:hypothetical protein
VFSTIYERPRIPEMRNRLFERPTVMVMIIAGQSVNAVKVINHLGDEVMKVFRV